jgi:hypothetical protein
MVKISHDDSGQFLLLTGIIISVGMIILLIFINQSSMGGYSSSDSIMNFPKNDIRDIRSETLSEAFAIGQLENNNLYAAFPMTKGQHRLDGFNASFNDYAWDIQNLTAANGCMVNVSAVPLIHNDTIANATIWIYYNNSETEYNETMVVNVGGT